MLLKMTLELRKRSEIGRRPDGHRADLSLTEQFARLSVEQMDLGAGGAPNYFVCIIRQVAAIIILAKPMLNLDRSFRTFEGDVEHAGTGTRWPSVIYRKRI
jgi:hypothetical protein